MEEDRLEIPAFLKLTAEQRRTARAHAPVTTVMQAPVIVPKVVTDADVTAFISKPQPKLRKQVERKVEFTVALPTLHMSVPMPPLKIARILDELPSDRHRNILRRMCGLPEEPEQPAKPARKVRRKKPKPSGLRPSGV